MILDKLLHNDQLTSQEREVLQYVSNNPQKVLAMTVHEIAKATYSSSSTVIRLCQKAGMSGFTEFKYQLAVELPTIIELENDLKSSSFSGNELPNDVLAKIATIQQNSLSYTKDLFDTELLERVAHLVNAAQRIEIYGDGLNYPLAQLFCWNFQEVGVDAQAYNSLNLMHAKSFQNYDLKPLAFVLTHTGNNTHMYDIAKQLKGENYVVVVVCDTVKRRICQVCDETMVIKTTRNTMDLSNIVYVTSIQYLFNVLMSMKMIDNYDKIQELSELVEQNKDK